MVRATLAFLALALLAPAALAATEYEKRSGGLIVYLGVLPAALLQGPSQSAELGASHGGSAPSGATHHVVVAVYDEATRNAVTDASVEVRVVPLGRAETRRQLDVMKIGATTTYGGFFPMPLPGPYTIHVSVRRPQAPPISVQFAYSHPR